MRHKGQGLSNIQKTRRGGGKVLRHEHTSKKISGEGTRKMEKRKNSGEEEKSLEQQQRGKGLKSVRAGVK